MSNLLTSLRAGAQTLQTFERAVNNAQNNVMNASTPGYVRQTMHFRSVFYGSDSGSAGGVQVAGIQSSRSDYAERIVQARLSEAGASEQLAQSFRLLENGFALNDPNNINSALDRLYTAGSAWSVAPNSTSARQNVITAAADVATSFRRAATTVASVAAEVDNQLQETVHQINSIGNQIRDYNAGRLRGAMDNAAADAVLHENLDRLAELVDFQAYHESDGTVTVVMGGQLPMVSGVDFHELSLKYNVPPDPPPPAEEADPIVSVLDDHGRRVESYVRSGKLTALLSFRNETIPSLQGGPTQVGQLNELAKAAADRINEIITAGWDADAEPFFVYSDSPTTVASTLYVNPEVVPAMLDAAEPPAGPANGKALKLAGLASSIDPADRLEGYNYTAFYGQIVSEIGKKVGVAQDEQNMTAQLLVQAQSLRSELSGVSLDEEAVVLVQLQRAYQATARVITVLDELSELTVNLGAR